MGLSRIVGHAALGVILGLCACSGGSGGTIVSRSGSATEPATPDRHVQAPTRSGVDVPGNCIPCNATFTCQAPGASATGNDKNGTDLTLSSTEGKCSTLGVFTYACGGDILAGGTVVGSWSPTPDGFAIHSASGDLFCAPKQEPQQNPGGKKP